MIPIIEIEEYLTEAGASPFGDWFNALDPQAAAIIAVGLACLAWPDWLMETPRKWSQSGKGRANSKSIAVLAIAFTSEGMARAW